MIGKKDKPKEFKFQVCMDEDQATAFIIAAKKEHRKYGELGRMLILKGIGYEEA